jgi:twitching motility two-component system response regulator PilG
MSSKKTFAVAMIGIPEHERNILKNIFNLSLYRPHTYTLAGADEPGQIVLVNADDPEALAKWQTLRDESAGTVAGESLPLTAIMIAKDNPPAETRYRIRRPFVASRVLKVLDQFTSECIGLNAKDEGIAQPTTPLELNPIALVVDDSRTVRKQIQQELAGLGIEIDTADTGEDALELINLNRYNLVFLDIMLPGIDGYQVCKYIKKHPLRRVTPVIIISGKSSTFDRIRAALAGCDMVLTKPVKKDTFRQIVQQYLKK